jgi:hypothetical protein
MTLPIQPGTARRLGIRRPAIYATGDLINRIASSIASSDDAELLSAGDTIREPRGIQSMRFATRGIVSRPRDPDDDTVRAAISRARVNVPIGAIEHYGIEFVEIARSHPRLPKP